MSELIRGLGFFVYFDEEGANKSIIAGIVGTVGVLEESRIHLYAGDTQIYDVPGDIFHGSLRELVHKPCSSDYVFNFAGVRFQFPGLFFAFGKKRLSVGAYIPTLDVAKDSDLTGLTTNYGPLQINVPASWYQELESSN